MPAPHIYLSVKATDLRKSYNSLSIDVQNNFKENALNGAMFVFYNKSKDRLKILYWHINGFCIWQKRLEQGRFILPSIKSQEPKITLSAYQLQGLMQAIDCWHVKEAEKLNYKIVV